MAMSNQYTLYHLHSDLSNGVTNIDSVTKYGEYIERAKECGMKAMAFTEHGSVFEWWHKKSAIEARPSLILCKPPMWCIIGTPHWRFYYGKKESHTGRK